MAITQPGGAGTTIFVYDDSDNTNHAAAPGPHTWAEISAAFPADFVSNGTNVASYRAKVTVQIGDGGTGTATTTLTDTDAVVIWDNTRTLAFRSTQTTSWFLNLGVKIGSGDQATGVRGGKLVFGAATTLRGTCNLYGATIRQTSGALTWNPVDGAGEAINTLFQSTATGTAPFNFGTVVTAEVANLYNCDFSHTTANQVVSNLNVLTSERITIGAAAPTALLSSGASSVTARDLALFGAPTQSDLRWATNGAILWALIRPRWTGNAPKFTTGSAGNPNLSGATVEYWLWNVKVVDAAGNGIAGIPVKLTDAVGNVQVNTTTDANGEITFGAGLFANAVAVADWYVPSGTTVAIRHRSPFLVEINTGAGANLSYGSRAYLHNWAGMETVTNDAGTFGDMNDVLNLGEVVGSKLIEDIALEAEGVRRIEGEVPELVH